MEINPTTTIIGIIGTIITAFFIHLLIKVRDKKNNFLSLSDDLRKPFLEAKSIFDINTRGLHKSCEPSDVFIQIYSDQRRSIYKIIPHIPRRKRIRLQVAWNNYENQINKENPSSWFTHDNFYKKEKNIFNKRENLIKQLDKILFFFDYHNMFSIFNILK